MMTKMAMMKLAASTLVLGVTMVGCSMTGQARHPAALSDARAAKVGAAAAAQASKAMSRHRTAQAVEFAETAVAAQPRNADYRLLLGQAYLAAGRFASAATSFSDTLTLDPNRERAALNLALAQTALGKTAAAKATLVEYREKLSAADYGLATALAGDPKEAVRVLEIAARAPDATAKTRQNLALAYALDGQWANAKVLAEQDLAPSDADRRMVQWASFAKPTGSWDQVASLLGVHPAVDAGQPTRLALDASPAVQVAQVDAPVAPAPVADSVALALATAATPAAPPAVEPAAPAFEVAAVQPSLTPAARAAPVIHAAVTPIRTAMPAVRRIKHGEAGQFVVQLGAFANAAGAERAWSHASGRYGLASYDPVNGVARSRTTALVRLSVGGFADHAAAQQMCTRIRSTGGTCFVRSVQGDAPAQWVQRARTTRVASR